MLVVFGKVEATPRSRSIVWLGSSPSSDHRNSQAGGPPPIAEPWVGERASSGGSLLPPNPILGGWGHSLPPPPKVTGEVPCPLRGLSPATILDF